jgi:phosphatidylglycerophosphatase A
MCRCFHFVVSGVDISTWDVGWMEVSESLERRRVVWKTRNVSRLLIRSIATGFGVGYLPLAPGTWGSLAAVVLVILIHQIAGPYQLAVHVAVTILLFPLAWFTSDRVAQDDEDQDPDIVVIDEVFGQFLCLLWVPVISFYWIIGFALFRFFDIVKPFPAKQSERLPGGLGIVMDDLVAGLYAGLILWLIYAI